MEYVLTTSALSKTYRKFEALKDLTMHIPKGAIYGFVGRNGAGKTTLIRVICGLQEPTSGDYTLYGISNKDRRISKARRRMGAVVETPSIYLDMTAEENLKQQALVLGVPNYDSIPEILKLVGLENTGKKPVKAFSLGMRQRLGLANALMSKPEIMVLDEPINGLDPQGIVEIRELLLKHNREEHITILIASHSLSELSLLCTDYIFINKGEILQTVSALELKNICREYYHIGTDNNSLAAAVLSEKLGLTRFEVERDGSIRLYEGLENIREISKALFENGIIPLTLGINEANLEQYYLNMVGEEALKEER